MSDILSALFVISYLFEMSLVRWLAWLCDPLYTIELQRLNDFINDTFSMLNLTEHEIYHAHKCLNANNLLHFNIY